MVNKANGWSTLSCTLSRPAASGPVRTLGPGRSWRTATWTFNSDEIFRTASMVAACSAWVPCEKLSRATFVPAATMARNTLGSRDAGPIVATIFVRLRAISIMMKATRSDEVLRAPCAKRGVHALAPPTHVHSGASALDCGVCLVALLAQSLGAVFRRTHRVDGRHLGQREQRVAVADGDDRGRPRARRGAADPAGAGAATA